MIQLKQFHSNSPIDFELLQRALESAPDYWLRLTGKFPGSSAAAETFRALPDEKTASDKFVFGIFNGRELIGCADIVRGYPNSETAMLGLLLLGEAHQHRGIGRSAYEAIEDILNSWEKVRMVRIGVVAVNESVLPFWKSLGFTETGVRRPYQDAGIISETIVLEKSLR